MAKLTKAEHLEMENKQLEQRIAEKEEQILLLNKTVEMLNVKLRQSESQNKLNIIDKQISTKKGNLANLKKESREFNEKLKKKYKIEGSFSINPDTGEIITE